MISYTLFGNHVLQINMKAMTFTRKNITVFLIGITLFFFHSLSSDNYAHSSEKNKASHYSQSYLIASNDLISAEQASSIAKQGKDSKVLKITKKSEGNREYYRVKLLSSKGHVQIILIDARSGVIIQESR